VTEPWADQKRSDAAPAMVDPCADSSLSSPPAAGGVPAGADTRRPRH